MGTVFLVISVTYSTPKVSESDPHTPNVATSTSSSSSSTNNTLVAEVDMLPTITDFRFAHAVSASAAGGNWSELWQANLAGDLGFDLPHELLMPH